MQRTLFVSILVSAATASAEIPDVVADGDSLGVIPFGSGSARVAGTTLDDIDEIASWHAQHPDAILVIEGHASPVGSRRANLRLSQQRTDAVREALIEAGADPTRVALVAHGETRVDDAKQPRANRRVVIRARRTLVELAREQRDPEVGEDAQARAPATTTNTTRGDAVDTRGATAAPARGTNTVVVVPSGGNGAPIVVARGGIATGGPDLRDLERDVRAAIRAGTGTTDTAAPRAGTTGAGARTTGAGTTRTETTGTETGTTAAATARGDGTTGPGTTGTTTTRPTATGTGTTGTGTTRTGPTGTGTTGGGQ